MGTNGHFLPTFGFEDLTSAQNFCGYKSALVKKSGQMVTFILKVGTKKSHETAIF